MLNIGQKITELGRTLTKVITIQRLYSKDKRLLYGRIGGVWSQ